MTDNSIESMLDKLLETHYFLKRMMKPESHLHGTSLTGSTFKVLFFLYHHEELTASEISKMTFIAKPNCSKAIDTLVNNGLAERRYDKKDRRILRVSLTGDGKSFVDNHRREMLSKLTNRFSELDNRELMTFRSAVDEMHRIMSKMI